MIYDTYETPGDLEPKPPTVPFDEYGDEEI